MSNAGFHNDNLETYTKEYIKGGSWKKQRIIFVMPAASVIPFKVAVAMRCLMIPPNQGLHIIGAEGLEVGEAYSKTIEGILNHPDLSTWEYILTMEHDNLPPSDGVMKLVKRMEEHPEYCAISGLYFTKGHGGVPQIWGDPLDPFSNYRPQPPKQGQLVECCGIGMGFALWRLETFKDQRLRKPWFKTVASASEGMATQDLYFASDARKHGYRFAVDCDVQVGHYDLEGKFGIPDFVW